MGVGAGTTFGFEGTGYHPFNSAQFYSGKLSNNQFTLADDAYRVLIRAKILANISLCTIPELNQILLALFPNRGNIYVVDGRNMTMTVTANFTMTPVEESIILRSNAFPRPAGVALSLVHL